MSQQNNDFAKLYRAYSEGELQELAQTMNELTEPAQQALKAEFARRDLGLPAVASKRQTLQEDSLRDPSEDQSKEYSFEFAELEDAILAQSFLRSAGIESLVPNSELSEVDTPRLIVAPQDAQAAELILSRVIGDKAGSEEDARFTGPACPKCGAPDPVLQSVEPNNQWRCEVCNHLWTDADLD